MNKGEIIVDIEPDGSTTVSVNGVEGPMCENLTAKLEEDLGVVVDRKQTADYHKKALRQRKAVLG